MMPERGDARPCAFCGADRAHETGRLRRIQIDGTEHPACASCRSQFNANCDLDRSLLERLLGQREAQA